MTEYEYAKQVAIQMPAMTDFVKAKEVIRTYTEYKKYTMLLCNDLRYYTVFNKHTDENNIYPALENEVIECIQTMCDEIISITLDEELGMVEIWIKMNDEAYVMYLFDYTEGVIDCA